MLPFLKSNLYHIHAFNKFPIIFISVYPFFSIFPPCSGSYILCTSRCKADGTVHKIRGSVRIFFWRHHLTRESSSTRTTKIAWGSWEFHVLLLRCFLLLSVRIYLRTCLHMPWTVSLGTRATPFFVTWNFEDHMLGARNRMLPPIEILANYSNFLSPVSGKTILF